MVLNNKAVIQSVKKGSLLSIGKNRSRDTMSQIASDFSTDTSYLQIILLQLVYKFLSNIESVITNWKQKPEMSSLLETQGKEFFSSHPARGDAEMEQPSLLPLAGRV